MKIWNESEYIGVIGERIVIDAVFISKETSEDKFGSFRILNFSVDGKHKISIKTTSDKHNLTIGKLYNLDFMVKSHWTPLDNDYKTTFGSKPKITEVIR
jgi:hypothetical protein